MITVVVIFSRNAFASTHITEKENNNKKQEETPPPSPQESDDDASNSRSTNEWTYWKWWYSSSCTPFADETGRQYKCAVQCGVASSFDIHNPTWISIFLTNWSLLSIIVFQFLIPICIKSSFTSSFHLFLGPPLILFSVGFHSMNFFTFLISFLR